MIYSIPWVIKHWFGKSKQEIQVDQINFIASAAPIIVHLSYIKHYIFLTSSWVLLQSSQRPQVPYCDHELVKVIFLMHGHTHIGLAVKKNKNYREHWGVGFVGASGFPRRFHCTAWLVSSNIPRLKQMDQHNQVIKRVTASVLLSGTILETFLCNSSTSSFE